MSRGEALLQTGDALYDFAVILASTVDVVVEHGKNGRVLVSHGLNKIFGELNLPTRQAVHLTARLREGGDVLATPTHGAPM